MAKMLCENRDGTFTMEMTIADWRKIHKDFKSETGQPKSVLVMLPDTGSTIVDVLIVKNNQDLRRTICKDYTSPTSGVKLAAGTEVIITEQTASGVYVTAGERSFFLHHGHIAEHRERWGFTDKELRSPETCKGTDEFVARFTAEDNVELAAMVQRNGMSTNRYDSGTVGVSLAEQELAEGCENLYRHSSECDDADTEWGNNTEIRTWRNVLTNKDGKFITFV